MTAKLELRAHIGDYLLTSAESVGIESSYLQQFDFAKINLVKRKVRQAEPLFYDKIQVGMPVEINVGWAGTRRVEFTGFVTGRQPGNNYAIECQDRGYLLRQVANRKSFREIKLRDMIRELIPRDIVSDDELILSPSIADATLKNVSAPGATVYEALRWIKDHYLVYTYFRGLKCYVGMPYYEFTTTGSEEDFATGRRARFGMQWNVLSNSLRTLRRADHKLRVRARAIQMGTKFKADSGLVGDLDSPTVQEKRIVIHAQISDAELRRLAEEQYKTIRYDGYMGSFTSFGYPYIMHSGTVELYDDFYPERSGLYLVSKTIMKWGGQGFRREIFLTRKIGELPPV